MNLPISSPALKLLLIITLIAALLVVTYSVVATSTRVTIIKKSDTKNGISVIYQLNNDTFALDYLTPIEYKNLINK